MVYMSIGMTWQTGSTSSNETELLGQKLGKLLKGREFIELVSDLGGGKTTFVRGLARGMGSQDKVASPTFTIRREYQAGKLTLYHFDFYRLPEPGMIKHDLAEVINLPNSVVVAEWGKVVKDVMPAKRLKINIKTTGENSREFKFEVPESLDYLSKGLK